jgi:predicted peroxiredoxin
MRPARPASRPSSNARQPVEKHCRAIACGSIVDGSGVLYRSGSFGTQAEDKMTEHRKEGDTGTSKPAGKVYAVIINSKEPETVWNAFRFASAATSKGNRVSVFLMGPAVEIEGIDSSKFDVRKILDRFNEMGGEILSCGTCLRLRKMEAAENCPISTMDTLVRLTEEADRVVTFG